jgi:hypothetical protein
VRLHRFVIGYQHLEQHDEEEPMTTPDTVTEGAILFPACDRLIDAGDDDAAQTTAETIVDLGDGVLIVPIAGELTATQPISTGLCIVCHQPAGWHESERITAPDNSYSIWVHHRCKSWA